MFHILGFLFIFVIAILLIGLSIVGSVVRTIFGLGRRSTSSRPSGNTRQTYYSTNEKREESSAQSSSSNASHKKIFNKDEGEYVDFEEIK